MPSSFIVQPSILNLTAELTGPPNVPIDTRYSSESYYSEDVPLDQRSLLATATVTMAKLAMMDFYGQMGNFQSTRVPGFSSISIQFRVTAPARQVETRIAVWAIFEVISNMALTGRYEQARLKIFWNSARIATLRVSPRASSQLTIEQRRYSLRNVSDKLPYLQSPANDSAAWKNDNTGSANARATAMYVLSVNTRMMPKNSVRPKSLARSWLGCRLLGRCPRMIVWTDDSTLILTGLIARYTLLAMI